MPILRGVFNDSFLWFWLLFRSSAARLFSDLSLLPSRIIYLLLINSIHSAHCRYVLKLCAHLHNQIINMDYIVFAFETCQLFKNPEHTKKLKTKAKLKIIFNWNPNPISMNCFKLKKKQRRTTKCITNEWILIVRTKK